MPMLDDRQRRPKIGGERPKNMAERREPPAEAASTTTGKAGGAGLWDTEGAASCVMPWSSASSVSPGGRLYASITFLRPESLVPRWSSEAYRTQGTD